MNTLILSLAVALAACGTAMAQDDNYRDGKTAEPATTETKLEKTVRAVVDAAVDFVTSVAMDIAKAAPAAARGGVEHQDTWDKQSLSLGIIRDSIRVRAQELRVAVDGKFGTATADAKVVSVDGELGGGLYGEIIASMRATLAVQMAIQRENAINSPRDAASGFVKAYDARAARCMALDKQLAAALVALRKTR